MAEIRVFHTHIEVYPYEKGDCPSMERMLSKWDDATFKYISIGYYVEGNILYLPRGINTSLLEGWFGTQATIVTKCDNYTKIKSGVMLLPEKDETQVNAINFLCGQNDYAYTSRYSQFGLNLATGDGKTYCAISAILRLKIKAIIITHQTKIKDQWIETIKDKTSFKEENLCNITGSDIISKILKGDINAEIYLVNQQTISAYAREHGWNSIREFFKKIKVGIKVIDESHKFFENTLMIDYFSNVYKSFYLTATFGRSDAREVGIYKKAYSHMVHFSPKSLNYIPRRKHIIFVICYFKSIPEYGIVPPVKTAYGFSSYKYIDYELQEEHKSLMKVLHKILEQTENLEGKTAILSPKVDSVDYIAKNVKDYYGYDIGTIYSKNTQETNDKNKEKDYISTTIKSIGEGTDIKGLRVLINLEPIGSKIIADQVAGRLREYSEDKDTYLFYPVDTTINESYKFLKRILPTMKSKCKEIKIIKM